MFMLPLKPDDTDDEPYVLNNYQIVDDKDSFVDDKDSWI